MEHLTSTQQKLVEDNHNLIYGIAHKNKINLDEYYDVLAIGLCKAAMQYDESKGQFSTFAYQTMLFEYLGVIRHNKIKSAIPENETISMNTKIDNGSETPISLADMIPSYDDMEDNIVSKDYVEFLCNKLQRQEEKDIVILLASGMSQVEVAESLGVSRQRVGQRLNSIRKRLQRFVA